MNTTSSRITLRFDVQLSLSLSEWQKGRIREKLAGYIDKDGVLAVSCETHRSQHANRREVLERCVMLLQRALKQRAVRRATRPTLASKLRRVDAKKQRSGLKRTRGRVRDE